MSDFPAAHSADTDWFAIDADENVAVLFSGEAGAVPDSAFKLIQEKQIQNVYSLIEYLPKDDRGIVHLKADGKTAAQGATLKTIRDDISARASVEWVYGMLLVLSTEEVIDKLSKNIQNQNNRGSESINETASRTIAIREYIIRKSLKSDRILRFTGEPVVIYITRCGVSTIESLIESGEILGGKYLNLENLSLLLGLFSYKHGEMWENWIAGPYRRDGQPEKTLKLAELSLDIQNIISLTLLDQIHFQDAKIIQPIEYTKCYTWDGDDNWIDTKGQIHGNVEDIEEIKEEIDNWLEQLKQE